MLRVACPPLKLDVPSKVAPSKNWTLPVGVPDNTGVTVAVKVTVCPNTDGLDDDETAVVVSPPEFNVTELTCGVCVLSLVDRSNRYCMYRPIGLIPPPLVGIVLQPLQVN
jgi:hypothetical protein